MQLFRFVFLIPVVLMQCQLAAAGDRVRNGGGVAEQNISLAYLHLDTMLKACLTSDSCLTSSPERLVGQMVHKSMPKEYQTQKPLVFLAGSKHKDIFFIDGSMRTAVTGNSVGSIIYVNKELIYFRGSRGVLEPISVGSAMGLLLHELGHHHPVKDHNILRLAGAHLESFCLSTMDILKVDNYMDIGNIRPPELVMTAVHQQAFSGSILEGPESIVLFADEQRVTDLTSIISSALQECPSKKSNAVDKVMGYRLYNMRWGYMSTKARNETRRTYRIKSSLEALCEDAADVNFPIRFDVDHEVIIELPINFHNMRKWQLDLKKVKILLAPLVRQ